MKTKQLIFKTPLENFMEGLTWHKFFSSFLKMNQEKIGFLVNASPYKPSHKQIEQLYFIALNSLKTEKRDKELSCFKFPMLANPKLANLRESS